MDQKEPSLMIRQLGNLMPEPLEKEYVGGGAYDSQTYISIEVGGRIKVDNSGGMLFCRYNAEGNAIEAAFTYIEYGILALDNSLSEVSVQEIVNMLRDSEGSFNQQMPEARKVLRLV